MNSVERVKQLCADRKIPISRLEKELGFANGYIGQLRKGVFPDDRLLAIANYLNVQISDLIGINEKENPPVVSDEGNKKELLIEYINHMNQDQLDQAGAFLKWLLSNPEK